MLLLQIPSLLGRSILLYSFGKRKILVLGQDMELLEWLLPSFLVPQAAYCEGNITAVHLRLLSQV